METLSKSSVEPSDQTALLSFTPAIGYWDLFWKWPQEVIVVWDKFEME